MKLSEIYIYPIKSLKGISLTQSNVEERGLCYDRRWMLVDKNGTFISQRDLPQLVLFQVWIAGDHLTISYPGEPTNLKIPLSQRAYTSPVKVRVWKDEVQAYEAATEQNKWFSKVLNQECKLVFMAKSSIRLTDKRYTEKDTQVSFADGYPFLLISEESLSMLNKKLDKPLPMDRFRPNFVIQGAKPHLEDDFAVFKIGSVTFNAVKPCARCIVPTINQKTGKPGKEPLKTLMTYRKSGNNILFGQNLCLANSPQVTNSRVYIGDEITVLKRKLK